MPFLQISAARELKIQVIIRKGMHDMKNQLHHVALSATNIDWYIDFFTDVFEMTLRKSSGDAPDRKIWFYEGIQLNECSEKTFPGTFIDHLALSVEDMDSVIKYAVLFSCKQISENWLELPDGLKIELM